MELTKKSKTSNLTKLISVSIGHFANDFYVNLVQPTAFLFASALNLNLTQQGSIVVVMIVFGSLSQPFIGYIVDKNNKPGLLILSIIWISFFMSITGLTKSYYVLLTVVALGSLASALYHPLGSTVSINLMDKGKGKGLSLFVTIGGLAISVVPLVVLPIAQNYGLEYLSFLMIPGFIIALGMYLTQVHKIEISKKNKILKKSIDSVVNIRTLMSVVLIILIGMIKAFIVSVLLTYGAQIFIIKNINITIISVVLSLYLFAAPLGTIADGFLSDKFGYKYIFGLSMIFSCVFTGIFIYTEGIISIVTFILSSFFISCSNTSIIVLTHDLLPNNESMATGLILGLPKALGALMILLFGVLSDRFGLLYISKFILIPFMFACLLVWIILLSRKKEIKNLR